MIVLIDKINNKKIHVYTLFICENINKYTRI